ncbi:MAG: YebC/PmpR family DNA-binding transcriptional regulator, partial [Clostridia bacterium]
NKNRTAGDVRHMFDKFGGAMGQSGCVSFMFKRRGVIVIDKNAMNEDDLMMLAIEAGADDINTDDDEVYEIFTMPADLGTIREALEKQGIEILSADMDILPDNEIVPEEKHIASLQKFIEKLDELDDVQRVFHNAVLPDEE